MIKNCLFFLAPIHYNINIGICPHILTDRSDLLPNFKKAARLSNYMEKENGTKLSDRYSINL